LSEEDLIVMRTIVLFVVGSVLTAACQAQLPLAPRERTVVADPSMVLEARGAAIEVLPAVRAQASGGKATRLVVASPASTFSAL